MMAIDWSTSDTYLSVAVIVLLFLSGFFALAETSLVRMNKSRARSLRDEGRRGSKALVELAEAPEKFLNPLLLLVLICQLVSATKLLSSLSFLKLFQKTMQYNTATPPHSLPRRLSEAFSSSGQLSGSQQFCVQSHTQRLVC